MVINPPNEKGSPVTCTCRAPGVGVFSLIAHVCLSLGVRACDRTERAKILIAFIEDVAMCGLKRGLGATFSTVSWCLLGGPALADVQQAPAHSRFTQAHHAGHVALLNRPRAVPASRHGVDVYTCECECLSFQPNTTRILDP